MRARFLLSALLALPFAAQAQEPIAYALRYAASGDPEVHVTLTLPGGQPGPVTLIMPRTLPGGYSWRPYDAFVEQVQGFSPAGEAIAALRSSIAPRWNVGQPGGRVARIEYDVNVARMEREILFAVDSSRIRTDYAGLLGYSVFAFVEGLEERPIRLEIQAPQGWPVFTTLQPRAPADLSVTQAVAPDYYALADSQILLGTKFSLRELAGKVPLFVAVYAETDEDLDSEGTLAREAFGRVAAYFREVPVEHYTVHVELLRQISDRHHYALSQEHLDSGSFTLDISRAMTSASSEALRELNRFNYAHHMAHSWVPKRTYGAGYMPFQWETPPLIETVWFNEGFGRYSAIAALAAAMPPAEGERYRREKLAALRQLLERTPSFIRRMPMVEVSRAGSFLYTEDPRLAQNLYSRGALLAAEMDERIRAKTGAKKDFSDALRGALAWTRENRRGFRLDELPAILARGTGVDVREIIERWLQPLER